jgi:uncharacterized protein (DUF58 family)
MRFSRPAAFGVVALFTTLLAILIPSAGWFLMIFALPLWLLFVVSLVHSLRP